MVKKISSSPAIAQLQGNALAKLVQVEIERMILDGELPSGAKLSETTLAEQLGVSRPGGQSFSHARRSGTGSHQLSDAMDQTVKGDNAHDYHRFELKFHDRLLELAGNSKLTATYRKLVNELSLFRRQNLTHESMTIYSRKHRLIVKTFAAREPEAAGQARYQHVMNSRERTLRNYEAKRAETLKAAALAAVNTVESNAGVEA